MRAIVAAFLFLIGSVGAQAAETIMMTGKSTGTYIRFGQDIARLAGHFGVNLSVQPSAGSLENVEAVLRQPLTPFGIVQSDVLDFIASFSDDPELRRTKSVMRMVFPLYNEEVHILARQDVQTLADLRGKQVAVGAPNSGTLLTATLLLAAAGIEPGEEVRIDTDEALAQLREGRIDAMFYVAGRPAKLFAEGVTDADGLHLVPITEAAVRELYPSSTIPAGTYRWQEEEVPTVAVRAVLMTYDYSKPTAYHRATCDNVGKMARIIADNLDWLRGSGRGHPKWQEVDLDASLVSWERSRCAEAGLNGPQSYRVTAQPADCGSEDNAIRRKLCIVKRQMLLAPEAAVSSAAGL